MVDFVSGLLKEATDLGVLISMNLENFARS
jgi:hypothetical protein